MKKLGFSISISLFRREISSGLCAGIFAALLLLSNLKARGDDLPPALFSDGDTVLFQGDSITDGNRGRSADPNHILGHGYVFIIAAKYGSSYPEKHLTFINRGVGGNKVSDLAARWQNDTLNLKPTVLSVLIGVNDLLHNVEKNPPGWVDAYEKTYDQILKQAVDANPKIKLILCEPFILPGKRNEGHWDDWQSGVQQLQSVVARLAEKYHAPVVHLQKVFDAAAKHNTPPDYWIWDGIHPTYSGHQLVADEWVRTYLAFYAPASNPSAK